MPDGLEQTWDGGNRGAYIKIYSGRRFYLNDPQPNDFTIGDVAYHLAGINRYTGGSRFTVAQHCVVAAEMAKKFYPQEALLPARMLIHDADEAFYGDVSSPLKSLLPDYKELEHKGQLAMEKKFDCLFIGDPLVKEVDYRMWLTECEASRGNGQSYWRNDYSGPLTPFELTQHEMTEWFTEWSPRVAEEEWLLAYRKLFPWQH